MAKLSRWDRVIALTISYLPKLLVINSGPLAQSVEQRTFNPWVVGSIPTGPTTVNSHQIKEPTNVFKSDMRYL